MSLAVPDCDTLDPAAERLRVQDRKRARAADVKDARRTETAVKELTKTVKKKYDHAVAALRKAYMNESKKLDQILKLSVANAQQLGKIEESQQATTEAGKTPQREAEIEVVETDQTDAVKNIVKQVEKNFKEGTSNSAPMPRGDSGIGRSL